MAKNEKEQNKNKKQYFKDMKAELKKVVWPSAKQTANNTVAVIAITLALALIVFILDLCFDTVNKHGVTALQQKITSSYKSSKDDNTSSDENETSEENNTATNATVEATTENKSANTESKEENKNTTTKTDTKSKE